MSRKPNILLFLPDGMQADVLNNPACRTPNFDRVMRQGTQFSRAYTPSQVCSPARASLMTGMLPHNHGVLQVEHCVDDDQSVLRSQYVHWAQNLVDAGYRTGYFGKWHIERSRAVEQYGWQENGADAKAVIRAGTGDSGEGALIRDDLLTHYQTEPPGYRSFLHYGVTEVEPDDRTYGQVTQRALSYLDGVLADDDPWAVCVSFSEPNEPLVCHRRSFEEQSVDELELPASVNDPMSGAPALYRRSQRIYDSMTDEQWRQARACYFGLVNEVDGMLGQLLDKLEGRDALANTIVIVVSDHGRYLGAHGMDSHNIGAYEEAFHIPLVIAGPGIACDTATTARVGLHDLCPTILELAGAQPITPSDATSFANLLQGRAEASTFTTGFAENHGSRYPLMQRILWDDDWKFVFNGFDEDELYDLHTDPHELTNLASLPEHRQQVEAMMARMWAFIKRSGDRTLLETHYTPLRLAAVGPEVAVDD